MKKLLILIPMILLLTACNESVEVNLSAFERNINEAFSYDIFIKDKVQTICEDDFNISYWFPEKYNVCCALYSDKNSGVIEKYTVTSQSDNTLFNEFCNLFKKGILKNNQNINSSTFESDGMIIKIFEDVRYIEKNYEPTIKNELNENDINYPTTEITSKPEN
ncbi:MAG: hypothetical protein IJZ57_03945 [Clostridia bacterium]|nr:hypothetical protein [Clostridia bacterium]